MTTSKVGIDFSRVEHVRRVAMHIAGEVQNFVQGRTGFAAERTAWGEPKILRRCTLPLTADGLANPIVTAMRVMEVTPRGVVVTELHPEFSQDDVVAAAEATPTFTDKLIPMA